jgi:hypothetical protein
LRLAAAKTLPEANAPIPWTIVARLGERRCEDERSGSARASGPGAQLVRDLDGSDRP